LSVPFPEIDEILVGVGLCFVESEDLSLLTHVSYCVIENEIDYFLKILLHQVDFFDRHDNQVEVLYYDSCSVYVRVVEVLYYDFCSVYVRVVEGLLEDFYFVCVGAVVDEKLVVVVNMIVSYGDVLDSHSHEVECKHFRVNSVVVLNPS
jgi:hypothetical protein